MNMNRLGLVLSVVVVSQVSVATTARADDKADVKAVYQKFCDTMKAKDANGLLKIGTNDFTMSEGKGTPTPAAKVAEGLKKQFAMFKTVDACTAEVSDVKVKGKTATAKSKMHTVMTLVLGKDMPPAKIERFSDTTDTLVKTPEGWRFKTVVSSNVQMTLNGAKFDPKAMQSGPLAGKKQP